VLAQVRPKEQGLHAMKCKRCTIDQLLWRSAAQALGQCMACGHLPTRL